MSVPGATHLSRAPADRLPWSVSPATYKPPFCGSKIDSVRSPIDEATGLVSDRLRERSSLFSSLSEEALMYESSRERGLFVHIAPGLHE
jgi:hypothetical protein